jgi:tRNA pseudouridine38-40 synthase
MRRFKATISYDGTDYCGFEVQPGLVSIQGELEQALNKIVYYPEKTRVQVVTAGRTDAGVHALGQVIHFDIPRDKLSRIVGNSFQEPEQALVTRMNGVLAPSIRVAKVEPVDEDFSARFSAKERTYHYYISETPNAMLDRYSYFSKDKLDINLMNSVAEQFVGEHDFGSFIRQRDNQTNIRTILSFTFARVPIAGETIIKVEIVGQSFAHNMVRSLMSAFVMLGSGQRDADWLLEKLRNPVREGATGPLAAKGLVLAKIVY